MTHRKAVATMVLVTLLWSIAGVATRHLQSAAAFEVTFWRSSANALALGLLLGWQMGYGALWRAIRQGGPLLWWSGLCWAVMFTAFMVAMTLTTVANVLITMSLAPMFTALISRFTLGQRLPARTWVAIVLAGAGIAWMYGSQLGAAKTSLLGTLVSLTVPIGGSAMWALASSTMRARCASLTLVSLERTSFANSACSASVSTISGATRIHFSTLHVLCIGEARLI